MYICIICICISYYILYVIFSLNLDAIFLATTLSFAFLILMKLSTEIIIRLEVHKEKNCIKDFSGKIVDYQSKCFGLVWLLNVFFSFQKMLG